MENCDWETKTAKTKATSPLFLLFCGAGHNSTITKVHVTELQVVRSRKTAVVGTNVLGGLCWILALMFSKDSSKASYDELLRPS